MDNNRVVGLKNSFYKVYKVFLVLLLQVIIYELKVFVFKDFKTDVVINIVCRRNIDSLFPFLLTFADLLADVCHSMQYVVGGGGLIVVCKGD